MNNNNLFFTQKLCHDTFRICKLYSHTYHITQSANSVNLELMGLKRYSVNYFMTICKEKHLKFHEISAMVPQSSVFSPVEHQWPPALDAISPCLYRWPYTFNTLPREGQGSSTASTQFYSSKQIIMECQVTRQVWHNKIQLMVVSRTDTQTKIIFDGNTR